MAKRKRKNSYQQTLPKWVISVFAVIAVILSILTFGGDMIGLDTSLPVSYTHLDVYKRQGATLSCPLMWYFTSSCIKVGSGSAIA